jgi:hypothetical protein
MNFEDDETDAECDATGIQELFQWTPPHIKGEAVKTKLVIFDHIDKRYAILRERQSQLEIEQFYNLIDVCGIHPNALPRNVH